MARPASGRATPYDEGARQVTALAQDSVCGVDVVFISSRARGA